MDRKTKKQLKKERKALLKAQAKEEARMDPLRQIPWFTLGLIWGFKKHSKGKW